MTPVYGLSRAQRMRWKRLWTREYPSFCAALFEVRDLIDCYDYADGVVVEIELFIHNKLDPKYKRARKGLRKLQRLAQLAGDKTGMESKPGDQ